ncbi:MAG: single-stranded DNA-binding protein [Clostridia bacterium]|nr:single-stranded DNA-binding protein [Clostridia bacterium]
MNKVILMGRLTKEPELRYTSTNNTAVCSFTLAIDRKFSKQGEEKQADFIPVVAWSKLGEFCGKYFQKGRQVVVVGRIQTRTWDDSEGKKHYVTEVVAEEAYFADSKKGEGMPSRNTGGAGSDQTDGFYPIDDDDELPF